MKNKEMGGREIESGSERGEKKGERQRVGERKRGGAP